VLVFVKAL